MQELVDRIQDLSNYSFKFGIADSTITIALNDEESVDASDFLKMIEYGSPLHNIVATRPIERTWLEMKDYLASEYEGCIDLIMNDATTIEIDDRMRMIGRRLCLRLQQNVTSNIKNQISCQIFYKGRKIN